MIGKASLTSFSMAEAVLETWLSMAAFRIANQKDEIGEIRSFHFGMLTNTIPVL